MFVSIVMPAYNEERYISTSVESVLTQTHSDFELIVIDDGSSDNTPELLDAIAREDDRVRVIHQENQGISPTLNCGISLARANWIVRMDADDIMEPRRLERQLSFIAEHPDLAVASCLVTYINHDGDVIGQSSPELTTDEDVRRWRERNILLGFHHPGVIMRKDVVESVGWYRQCTVPAEDIDLWNRIADAGYRILVQPEHLLKYRIHQDSVTVRQASTGRERVQWLMECTLRRRAGLPEPTIDEFKEAKAKWPIWRRITVYRKELAISLYKKAAFRFSNGRRLSSVWLALGSAILDPRDTIPRIWGKFLRPVVLQRRDRIRRKTWSDDV